MPHGVGDLADRGMSFHGFHNHRHQIAGTTRGVFHGFHGGLPLGLIAFRSHGAQAFYLLALQRFVDVLQRNRFLVLQCKAIHPDHDCFLLIDGLLIFVSGVLDFLLHEAALDRLQHAAHGLNLFQIGERVGLNLVGQRFHVVRAGQGIDGLGRTRFVGDDLLGAQRDARRLLGGQCQRFVK